MCVYIMYYVQRDVIQIAETSIAFVQETNFFLRLDASSSQRVRFKRRPSTSCLIRSTSFNLYTICVSKSKKTKFGDITLRSNYPRRKQKIFP